MTGATVEVACRLCGQTHRLALDDRGRFEGPLPCNPKERVALHVDPREWRQVSRAGKSTKGGVH